MDDDTTLVEYGLFPLYTPSVALKIENVNFNSAGTGGTADIIMTNTPSCSYCANPAYNNNTISWPTQKEWCEDPQAGNSYWVVNANMSEAQCKTVDAVYPDGGWWFDGYISGFA